VVERDGLENRCARKRTVGSNPTLSAIFSCRVVMGSCFDAGMRKIDYQGYLRRWTSHNINVPAWLIDSTGEGLRRVATVPRIAVGFNPI